MTNWTRRFLDLARHIATWSKDPSTKVGAVIVDEERRVIATGYNGFPRGIVDTDERLHDRPTKYSLVVHAEANAVLNATRETKDATMYCTHWPCTECAKLIIQSGIKTIFVPNEDDAINWREEQSKAADMLFEAGVTLAPVVL